MIDHGTRSTAASRGVRGPSRRKRRAILDAAFEVFLERGFDAATLEQVADVAEVSRQTVYAHFGGEDDGVKESLFCAMVAEVVGQPDDPHPLAATLGTSEDVEADLGTYARHHLRVVMRPDLLRLRRMMIGEAERFPRLADEWYANGPERSYDLFAGWFHQLHARGILSIPDPERAARTFNWLVLSTPLNEAMARPGRSWTADELDAWADEAVRVFLTAHGA